MNRIVLDSSAVLALIKQEPGAKVVLAALPGSMISTVNSCEVLQKLIDKGLSRDNALTHFGRLGIASADFTEDHAIRAAVLRKPTEGAGLSLGDRACLALALAEGLPVLTSDRNWAQPEVGVEVRLIR